MCILSKIKRIFRISNCLIPYRLIIAMGLMTCATTFAFSQFKQLIVQAPDTVYVGEAFEVKVILVSNEWKGAGWDSINYPFKYLKTLNHKTNHKGNTSELNIFAQMVASRDGLYELPRFKATAQGKERLSTQHNICILPHKKYGNELSKAYLWLEEECQQKNPQLALSYRDSSLSIFSDDQNKCFVFVANHKYWDKLNNPILAYSTESNYHKTNNNYQDDPLVNQYIQQLRVLDTLHVAGSWQTCSDVQPLLDKTAWGQNAPYNLKSPKFNNKPAPIGCQVVALAQVMRYYKHPSMLEGQCWFYGPDDKYYKFDLDQWTPKWDTYADTYNKKNGNSNDTTIAHLCSLIAVSIDANFSQNVTYGNFKKSYRALCSNFGYSTQMSILENTSAVTILDAICQELSHNRPCIASWGGHSFVCDGIKNGFLHYNLGWDGSANGYYQPLLCQPSSSSCKNMLIKSLMVGIEPQPAKNEVTIRTEKGGQLKDLLSDEQKCSVTHLKIVGRLNSEDIKLIRHMAGAFETDATWKDRNGGSLYSLDLSEAKIVGDKEPFLTLPAADSWTHTRTSVSTSTTGTTFTTKKDIFDFSQMDEKRWKQFCRSVAKDLYGISYERINDNLYLAHFYTESDMISARMFYNCKSLKSIVLPHKIRTIDTGAFINCHLLKKIDIPNSVMDVNDISFDDCSSLDTIVFHKQYNNVNRWSRNCSPALHIQFQK